MNRLRRWHRTGVRTDQFRFLKHKHHAALESLEKPDENGQCVPVAEALLPSPQAQGWIVWPEKAM